MQIFLANRKVSLQILPEQMENGQALTRSRPFRWPTWGWEALAGSTRVEGQGDPEGKGGGEEQRPEAAALQRARWQGSREAGQECGSFGGALAVLTVPLAPCPLLRAPARGSASLGTRATSASHFMSSELGGK